MQHRELLRRDEARRVVMRRLRRVNQLEALVGPVVAGRAGDDAVEILREALRFHERLPAAARAAD